MGVANGVFDVTSLYVYIAANRDRPELMQPLVSAFGIALSLLLQHPFTTQQ